jgi:hypothetical protein
MRSPYTIVKTIPPHSYIDVSENGGEKRYNANNYTEAALKAHLSFNDPSGEQAIVDKIYNFEQDSTYEGQKTLKFYKQSYGILMNRPWRSEYDVTGYTDDDLYAILDVSTPVVDSELEAKIIQEIQKYVYDRSFQGRKFYQFFKDVYEHFFDVKRETSTTSDDSKYTYSELEKHDYNTSDVDKSREKKRQTKSTLLDSRYYEKDASTGELKQLAGNTIDGTNEKLRNELKLSQSSNLDDREQDGREGEINVSGSKTVDDMEKEKAVTVKDMEYVTGVVNPILKETYKRIVSVDSKYRDDDLYLMSTDFTLNFSETLKDVVSMKLYAVQLPVTWYTISESYGSNFFYIKPIIRGGTNEENTYGINNEHHEYQVEVEPGNYTAVQLIEDQVRDYGFGNMRSQYSDVNFGDTSIVYNPNQTTCNMTIDIQKTYTEMDYDVRYGAVISELLFNNEETHSIFTVKTVRSELLENWMLTSDETILFERYIPTSITDVYSENSVIDQSFSIVLEKGINRTAEGWAQSINSSIAANENIDSRSMVTYSGNAFYWKIIPNRERNLPLAGSKWVMRRSGTLILGNFMDRLNYTMSESMWTINTIDPTITDPTAIDPTTIKEIDEEIRFTPKVYSKGGVYIDPIQYPNDFDANDIVFTVKGSYNVASLINEISSQWQQNKLTYGSYITYDGVKSVTVKYNINKIYTTQDYKIVFYDFNSFGRCVNKGSPFRNAKIDSTLGFIIGYKTLAEYELTSENVLELNNTNLTVFRNPDTGNSTGSIYTLSSNSVSVPPNISPTHIFNSKITLKGNASVNTNQYNYFMILLDDFNQNHLNDGLVTLAPRDRGVSLPSYATRYSKVCNPLTNTEEMGISSRDSDGLTQKQIYSVQQIIRTQNENKRKNYNENLSVRDMFALLPIKSSGAGSVFVEYGGTLQQQERTYFGPVNIGRLAVKLVNDKGDVVDLNGGDWSFQLVCEQLYQSKKK